MKKVGNLEYDPRVIEKLCEENGISYLALFGSYLHKDNGEDSDIDFLVNFKDTSRMSLFDFLGVQEEFAETFKKKVDLVMTTGIDPYIKDNVLKEAELLYKDE